MRVRRLSRTGHGLSCHVDILRILLGTRSLSTGIPRIKRTPAETPPSPSILLLKHLVICGRALVFLLVSSTAINNHLQSTRTGRTSHDALVFAFSDNNPSGGRWQPLPWDTHSYARRPAILRCIYEQGAHDHHHHPVPTVKLARMHFLSLSLLRPHTMPERKSSLRPARSWFPEPRGGESRLPKKKADEVGQKAKSGGTHLARPFNTERHDQIRQPPSFDSFHSPPWRSSCSNRTCQPCATCNPAAMSTPVPSALFCTLFLDLTLSRSPQV